LALSFNVFAQVNKAVSDGDRFYGIKSYDQALPHYLQAIQEGVKDPMVYYKTAICYQKLLDENEHLKAIPYFEEAIKNGSGLPNI
jgi:tetratricopeptide (TPR) repeat protein